MAPSKRGALEAAIPSADDEQKSEAAPYEVNDHVLISPPYAQREGEPYQIGRIMEFMSAASIPSTSTAPGRVRIAYFLRPRDINSRFTSNHHLVIATMSSEIVDASHIRQKIVVRHKDAIVDLEKYRTRENSFYFHQYYDRYLRRYFDVLATEKIQNAPVEILQHLRENFDYIICEVGLSVELCDSQKGCVKCHKYCAKNEQVACALCSKSYHLTCLDPPLLSKPKLGFSFICLLCSEVHYEEVEAYMETGSKSKLVEKVKADTLSTKGKGKGRESLVVQKKEMRTFHGWPYRYYGRNTCDAHVLDPHDSFFPRGTSRIGNGRYQAVLTDWDPSLVPKLDVDLETNQTGSTGVKPKSKAKRGGVIHVRGGEETVKVIYSPTPEISEITLDSMVSKAKALPMYASCGVEVINKALAYLAENDPETSIAKLKKLRPPLAPWSDSEKKYLLDGVADHGNDLEAIAGNIKTKSLADIVKRYYMFLGHRMQEDVPAPSGAIVKSSSNSSFDHFSDVDDAEDSEEEGSIVESSDHNRGNSCVLCSTTKSEQDIWYRSPEHLGTASKKLSTTPVLCNDCGLRWRKYGIEFAPPHDNLKVTARTTYKSDDDQMENIAACVVTRPPILPPVAVPKVAKVIPVAKSPTPPPPPVKKRAPPAKPCLICKRIEPKDFLACCLVCGMSVHDACYGIDADEALEDWFCDLCDLKQQNKRLKIDSACVLCPPLSSSALASKNLTALDCVKPTEMNNYIHIICAVWNVELKFSNTSDLQWVEGIPLIPARRRDQECHICKIKDVGACLKCEDCPKHVHVSCAWTAAYKFVFEIHPVKKTRSKQVVTVKFKDEQGTMSPLIFCKDHAPKVKERVTYEIGERDPISELTALQVYTSAYKAAGPLDNFPLLRQARQLDRIIAPALTPSAPIDAPHLLSLPSAAIPADEDMIVDPPIAATPFNQSAAPAILKLPATPIIPIVPAAPVTSIDTPSTRSAAPAIPKPAAPAIPIVRGTPTVSVATAAPKLAAIREKFRASTSAAPKRIDKGAKKTPVPPKSKPKTPSVATLVARTPAFIPTAVVPVKADSVGSTSEPVSNSINRRAVLLKRKANAEAEALEQAMEAERSAAHELMKRSVAKKRKLEMPMIVTVKRRSTPLLASPLAAPPINYNAVVSEPIYCLPPIASTSSSPPRNPYADHHPHSAVFNTAYYPLLPLPIAGQTFDPDDPYALPLSGPAPAQLHPRSTTSFGALDGTSEANVKGKGKVAYHHRAPGPVNPFDPHVNQPSLPPPPPLLPAPSATASAIAAIARSSSPVFGIDPSLQ